MATATQLPPFGTAPIPDDETPPAGERESRDHDPAFPGSTPDAPYGYFTEGPKAGQPRTRRPRGSGTSAGRRGPAAASESQATAAAHMLAQMNSLVGLSLVAFKLPETAASIGEANQTFETMAREALLSDPALCRKILAGGMSSSKAQLIMAYTTLGIAILPSAQGEIRARRLAREAEEQRLYDESEPT